MMRTHPHQPHSNTFHHNHVLPQKRSEQRYLCEYLTLNYFIGTVFAKSAEGKDISKNPEQIRFSATEDEIFNYLVSALPKCSPNFENRTFVKSFIGEMTDLGELRYVKHIAEQESPLKGYASPLVAAARILNENNPYRNNNNDSDNSDDTVTDFFNPDSLVESKENLRNKQQQQPPSTSSSEVNKGEFLMWNPWRRTIQFTPACLGQQQTHQGVVGDKVSPLRFIPKNFRSDGELHLLDGELVQKFFSFVRSRVSSPHNYVDPQSIQESSTLKVCDQVTRFSRLHFFADALRVIGYYRVIGVDNFFNSMKLLGWDNVDVAEALLRDLEAYKGAVPFKLSTNGNRMSLDKIASSPSPAITFLTNPSNGNPKHQVEVARLEALIKKIPDDGNNSQQHVNNTVTEVISSSSSSSTSTVWAKNTMTPIFYSYPPSLSNTTTISSLKGAVHLYFDHMKQHLFPISTMEVDKQYLIQMMMHNEDWTEGQQVQTLSKLAEKKLIHFKNNKVCLGEGPRQTVGGLLAHHNQEYNINQHQQQQQQQLLQQPSQNYHHDSQRRVREGENGVSNTQNTHHHIAPPAPYSSSSSSSSNPSSIFNNNNSSRQGAPTSACLLIPPPAFIRSGVLIVRSRPDRLLFGPPPSVAVAPRDLSSNGNNSY